MESFPLREGRSRPLDEAVGKPLLLFGGRFGRNVLAQWRTREKRNPFRFAREGGCPLDEAVRKPLLLFLGAEDWILILQ